MAKRSVIFVHGHSQGEFSEQEWLRQTVGDSRSPKARGRLLEGLFKAIQLVEAGEEPPVLVIGSGALYGHATHQEGEARVVADAPTADERRMNGKACIMDMFEHLKTDEMRETFGYILKHPALGKILDNLRIDVESKDTFAEASLAVDIARNLGDAGSEHDLIDVYNISNFEHAPRSAIHTGQFIIGYNNDFHVRANAHYCPVMLHPTRSKGKVEPGKPAPVEVSALESAPHNPADAAIVQDTTRGEVVLDALLRTPQVRVSGYYAFVRQSPARFAAQEAARKVAEDAKAAYDDGRMYNI